MRKKTKLSKSVLRAARRLPTKWPTAFGNLVFIREMTNEHLRNAIASCRANSKLGVHYRALLREEARRSMTRPLATKSILLQGPPGPTGPQGPVGPPVELEGDPAFEDLRHRVVLLEESVQQQAQTGAKYRDEHDKLMLSTGGLWKTKAGDLLQVRDMDDQHLENAIRFLAEQDKIDPNLSAERKRREDGRRIQAEVEAQRGVVRFKVGDRVVSKRRGVSGVVRGANERWLTVELESGRLVSWGVADAELLPTPRPVDSFESGPELFALRLKDARILELEAEKTRILQERDSFRAEVRACRDELRQRDADVVELQTRVANQKDTIQQMRRDLSERTDQVLKSNDWQADRIRELTGQLEQANQKLLETHDVRSAVVSANSIIEDLRKNLAEVRDELNKTKKLCGEVAAQVLDPDEVQFLYDVLSFVNVVVEGSAASEFELWGKLRVMGAKAQHRIHEVKRDTMSLFMVRNQEFGK